VPQQAENQRFKDEDVRALAQVGLFSAGIIHEVKNALQGIANALILLDAEKDLKPQAKEWVGIARRELSRAIDVSRDTLALVREESTVPVRITDILEDVLSTYAAKIDHKGVAIDRRYEFHETIHGDPGAVRQVFANIVLNALESLPCHTGKLIIHTRACHVGEEGNVRRDKAVRGVRIFFADNGPGIPEENRRKVFEPLFSTKEGKGAGLGLWITQQLVRKQHGGLRLHSSDKPRSSGTCFSVFLPMNQNQQPKAAA
jgi:two-component system, NtrC family, sensor kinase